MAEKDRLALLLIGIVSIVVPIAVAILIFVPLGINTTLQPSTLPALNAIINTLVTISLISGYVFIRNKNIKLHRMAMLTALGLSVLFLISYIIYHSGPGHVRYNGEGVIKIIYLFILLTHIVLSAVVVPMALISVYLGISSQVEKHKKIARWTFPIWLYVAVTGVIVYLMVHQFNPGL